MQGSGPAGFHYRRENCRFAPSGPDFLLERSGCTDRIDQAMTRTSRHSGFRSDDTHGIAMMPGNSLLMDSDRSGWTNLYLSHAREAAWHGRLKPVPDLCFAFNMAGKTWVSRRTSRCGREDALLAPRLFSVIPSDEESEWEIRDGAEILLVYLRRGLLDRVAEEHGADPSRCALAPRFCHSDPFVEQISLQMLTALREQHIFGANAALHADYLSFMLAAHFFREHSSLSDQCRQGKFASGIDRHSVGSPGLRRAVDLIEAELDQHLTLDQLAKAAGIGPIKLSQEFARHFGQTPYRFIMARRLERARQLLSSSRLPIAEIALATGFSSQSHLTSVFTRSVGVSPGRYRKSG